MSMPANAEPERLIANLRPNARRLIGPAVLFIVLVGAMFWLTGLTNNVWVSWAIVAAGVLLMVIGSVLPFLAWLVRRYTITTRKLVVQHGLFVRVRKELLHSRGYQITVRRTAGQSLFRCGNIRIETSATELPLDLVDVPNPVLVQSVLQDLVEGNASAAESLIASHGAHATDTTKRFDPAAFNDTEIQ